MPALQVEISGGAAASLAPPPPGRALPLQQHPAYAKALSLGGATPAWLTVKTANGTLIAQASMLRRRFAGLLQVTSLPRGPVFFTDSDDDQRAAFTAIRQAFNKWRWQFALIQPEQADTAAARQRLRASGLVRVSTGFATAWLDLSPPVDTLRARLDHRFRHQLGKAEAERALTIHAGPAKPKTLDWLVAAEAEQQRRRRYKALPAGFARAYPLAARTLGEDCPAITAVAHKGGQRVAAALFLCHGDAATYHIGWTSPVGRQCHAQNAVLWQGITALRHAGIRWLDLGGVGVGPLEGITRFKLGTGAQVLPLIGAWM